MSDPIYALTLATALGCGLAGGVFFAFSSFVMGGLARLPAPQGIAAMQSINVTAVTPVFMTQLIGTAVACLVERHVARHRQPDRADHVENAAGGHPAIVRTWFHAVQRAR